MQRNDTYTHQHHTHPFLFFPLSQIITLLVLRRQDPARLREITREKNNVLGGGKKVIQRVRIAG